MAKILKFPTKEPTYYVDTIERVFSDNGVPSEVREIVRAAIEPLAVRAEGACEISVPIDIPLPLTDEQSTAITSTMQAVGKSVRDWHRPLIIEMLVRIAYLEMKLEVAGAGRTEGRPD